MVEILFSFFGEKHVRTEWQSKYFCQDRNMACVLWTSLISYMIFLKSHTFETYWYLKSSRLFLIQLNTIKWLNCLTAWEELFLSVKKTLNSVLDICFEFVFLLLCIVNSSRKKKAYYRGWKIYPIPKVMKPSLIVKLLNHSSFSVGFNVLATVYI